MGKSLRGQQWSEISVHAMHLAFLRAERDQVEGHLGRDVSQLVAHPNLSDQQANAARREALYSRRGPLLSQIPDNTRWHEVRFLRESHVPELLVIGRCGWDDSSDRNELLKVAKRKDLRPRVSPERIGTPILWAHTVEGPFTIMDGNHRLTAYAGHEYPHHPIRLTVYVGLSSSPCLWHLPDPVN